MKNNNFKQFFAENGEFIGKLPKVCIDECTHSGSCDNEIEYWQKELNFKVPRKQGIEYLIPFGAWEKEYIDKMTDTEISRTVLWLACWEINETGDWIGLI